MTMTTPLVFVVEDDPVLGLLFWDVLQGMGLDTQIIRDSRLASQHLDKAVPAMVTLDLHMPYVSGLEILTHIRGDSRLDKTKVAMITADAVGVKEARGKADLILIKPIGYFDLVTMVTKLLPQHAIQQIHQ